MKQKVRKIHFLHSASYGESENLQIGSYILKMGDGSIEDFPIIYGTNVRSERGDFRRLPEAETAWEARPRGRGPTGSSAGVCWCG